MNTILIVHSELRNTFNGKKQSFFYWGRGKEPIIRLQGINTQVKKPLKRKPLFILERITWSLKG